jgi:ketosteroid isomerase-like protein
MRLTRRGLGLAGGASLLGAALFAAPALSQSGDAAAVAAAVETLREAIVKADKDKLTAVAHDNMAYIHSSGRSETTAQYVAAYTSGKSTYKSLTLADHANTVVGDNAIVRHTFAAEIDRGGGKVDNVKIGVTQVWVKQGGSWKLLLRQGYKL